MPPITGCIISYNEEAKIADCLESLQGVVDEIVVIDSNSDDRTVEIARRYTERVIPQEFLGHVQQKNFAVEEASHDWILSLDCDERLSNQLRDSILARKESLDDSAAYRMPRKTYYINRWLNHCWYPDKKVRLFNRTLANWGGNNPHDHVEVPGGNVTELPGDILHYSFDSISDHLKTIDHFTEIAAQEAVAAGKTASVLSPMSHGAYTFFKTYCLKAGFLDGSAGLTVSVLSGMHAFVKYAKIRSFQKID